MTSFQMLPPELVAEILDLVIHSSGESLISFKSVADPTLYLQHAPASGDITTIIACLSQVCSLWYNIVRLSATLPPMSAECYLHTMLPSASRDNLRRDTGLIDLCIVVPENDARELVHGIVALDQIFDSTATTRLRSILLKDMSSRQGLLDLFQVAINSETVYLPLLHKIEVQFGKIHDIFDDRQTKTVKALAQSLALIPTLTELYWYSENFLPLEIPWAQLTTIFLHSKFSVGTALACLELCTFATSIGIEGIDGWGERSDAGWHRKRSFLLLPNLKHLTLEGQGNIFTILDDLSLPEIESVQIILSHPISGRGARISASASMQHFICRHEHHISIAIKVQVEREVTTGSYRREYVIASLPRGRIDIKNLSCNDRLQIHHPASATSSQKKIPKEITDFLTTLLADVCTLR